MIRLRRVLPAAALALGLSGAGVWTATAERHSAAGPQTFKAPDAAVVDCQTRSQVIPGRDPVPLRGRNYIAVGPVTFTAYFRDEPRAQLEPRDDRTTRIKAPIFVDAGSPVTVTLSGASARRAEIEIAVDRGGSVRGSDVRLIPCPPDATVAGRRVGRRTPFLGGFRINGPMCMRVRVLVDGAAESLHRLLPFGQGSCR